MNVQNNSIALPDNCFPCTSVTLTTRFVPPFFTIGTFWLGICVTLLIVMVTISPSALAQAKWTRLPPYGVAVSPPIADAGVERTIVVSGVWPDECAPNAVTLDTDLAAQLSILVLRPQVPQTLVPCAAVETPFRLLVTYTSKQRGVLQIFALAQSGYLFGPTRLITSPSTAPRGLASVTGLWYDNATTGSGLVFIHEFDGSDVVFGTWYVYGVDRKPRWYSIQNTEWSADASTLLGKLYETTSRACDASVPICSPVLDTVREVGSVRVKFITTLLGDPRTFSAATAEAFSPTGQLLFSSNIAKIGF
jgi:hypothetical protein